MPISRIRELSSPRPVPLTPSSTSPLRTAGGPGPPLLAPEGSDKTASPFGRLLRGLGHEADDGERLVHRVTDSPSTPLDSVSLLALQAGIYRYSATIDLAAQLVDKASSAVKSVVQSGQ
jgi:hypothetical protein